MRIVVFSSPAAVLAEVAAISATEPTMSIGDGESECHRANYHDQSHDDAPDTMPTDERRDGREQSQHRAANRA